VWLPPHPPFPDPSRPFIACSPCPTTPTSCGTFQPQGQRQPRTRIAGPRLASEKRGPGRNGEILPGDILLARDAVPSGTTLPRVRPRRESKAGEGRLPRASGPVGNSGWCQASLLDTEPQGNRYHGNIFKAPPLVKRELPCLGGRGGRIICSPASLQGAGRRTGHRRIAVSAPCPREAGCRAALARHRSALRSPRAPGSPRCPRSWAGP